MNLKVQAAEAEASSVEVRPHNFEASKSGTDCMCNLQMGKPSGESDSVPDGVDNARLPNNGWMEIANWASPLKETAIVFPSVIRGMGP